MRAAVERWWSDLRHEGRLTLSWVHLAALLLLVPLTASPLAASTGVDDRTLLLFVRAGLPLLAVALAPGLILRDVAVGSAELVATTRSGLGRVWLMRFLLTFAWLAVVLLILAGPLAVRVPLRFSPAAVLAASMVDGFFYMAAAAAAAHRLSSQTAGQITGILLWTAGSVTGAHPPGGMVWLGYLTPLSPYFFGSPAMLWANRAGWALAALFLVIREVRRLGTVDMLERKEP